MLILILSYLSGVVISYLLAKYFNWEDDLLDGNDRPPVGIFALVWFIGLPIVILMKSGSRIRDLGKRNREKKDQLVKFRIAQEAKAQKILKESEQEVENFVEELRQKSR
jgi:hypothetical protein